jgi:hypothetical protein
MHQRRLARLLLRPSLFSVVFTSLLSIALLAASVWPYTANNSVLSQYFYGPYGLLTTLHKSSDIANFTAAFSVSPVVYNLLIVAVAALVAIGVYAILQLFSKIIVNSYDTWHAIHNAGSATKSVEREIGTRLTIRLMSVLLWIAFVFFFITLIYPYCVYIARAGIDQLMNWGILHALAAFVVLFASMHVHVVFIRLLLLRPRVFGGKLDIMEAIYDAENNHDR